MPAGFPADIPIYTGARLTAGAAFSANGQTAWGMEWETLDTVDKVQAFYTSKLAQGDWSIKVTAAAAGGFSATFGRKSSSKVTGVLGAVGSSGVTNISLCRAGTLTYLGAAAPLKTGFCASSRSRLLAGPWPG